jgi:hypothetical protein
MKGFISNDKAFHAFKFIELYDDAGNKILNKN